MRDEALRLSVCSHCLTAWRIQPLLSALGPRDRSARSLLGATPKKRSPPPVRSQQRAGASGPAKDFLWEPARGKNK